MLTPWFYAQFSAFCFIIQPATDRNAEDELIDNAQTASKPQNEVITPTPTPTPEPANVITAEKLQGVWRQVENGTYIEEYIFSGNKACRVSLYDGEELNIFWDGTFTVSDGKVIFHVEDHLVVVSDDTIVRNGPFYHEMGITYFDEDKFIIDISDNPALDLEYMRYTGESIEAKARALRAKITQKKFVRLKCYTG